MTVPEFTVQHFLVCQSVAWEGPAGPRTLRTLEGVGYRIVVPPAAEPDFEFEVLWVYSRLIRRNHVEGKTLFRIVAIWHDGPRPPRRVWAYQLLPVRMTSHQDVVEIAWPLRPAVFPGLGRFELRLQWHSSASIGRRWRTMARDFLLIERRP
jgi:hypothetical protein